MENAAIDHDLLKRLAEQSAARPLLSVYLQKAMQFDELKQNEIRLKNARREAADQLQRAGMSESDIEATIEPLSNAGDALWSHAGRGVGIFIDEATATCVHMPNAVEDFVLAASHFHLKPLYSALPFVAPYYVLALSQNNVSLFSGDGTTLNRINFDEAVPSSLADVAGHELDERHLQHHGGNRGSGQAIFHGQGAGKDDTEAEIEHFLREADARLQDRYLDGSALVLAGVTTLLSKFRRISGYSQILEHEVSGNVEHMTVSDLHEKSWPIIERQFQQSRTAELEQIINGASDRPMTTDLTDILNAAADGRIARLFLAADRECWGGFDSETRRVTMRAERKPTDNDLLDLAATRAYLTGAEIWPAPKSELPDDTDTIAVLRY